MNNHTKSAMLKSFLKQKYSTYEKERKEAKGYNKILKEKIKLAKRQAFAEESVKQARLQAQRRAKAKYTPRPQVSQGKIIPKTAPKPKPVIKRTTGRKIARKTKKKIQRAVRKETPKQSDFDRIFWNS